MTNDRREFLRLAGLAVAAAALEACNSDGPKSAQKLLAFAERKNVGVEEFLFRHTSMDRAKESAKDAGRSSRRTTSPTRCRGGTRRRAGCGRSR